jgi:hypothetical protein
MLPNRNAGKELNSGGQRRRRILNLIFSFGRTSFHSLPEILGYLVQSGTAPFEFTPHRISLEDLFMEIVGEDRGL